MQAPDQIQARNAANKFIAANANADHLMAVVDFGGALRIVQNFTANADLLRAAVAGVKNSSVNPNANVADNQPVTVASSGLSSLSTAEADFGARSMLLAVRSLAKNLRSVPGRKMVVLFSGGFALTPENESELTATIDACNKANVAIYALDARGLVATAPGGSARNNLGDGEHQLVVNRESEQSATNRARLVLASYSAGAAADPQRPGGGGGTGGTGGGGGGRGTGGGTGGAGGTGGKGGGTGGTGAGGKGGGTGGGTGAGSKGGGTGGKTGGGTTGGGTPRQSDRTRELTILIHRITSHAPSFLPFHNRRPPTSRFWPRSRKAPAGSPSSTPTICSAAWNASGASKVSFISSGTARKTRPKAPATR